MNKPAKQYYETYLADDNLSDLNKDLVEEVLKEKPMHVFEYGAGTGKNLRYIQKLDKTISVTGIDVSKINYIYAVVRNEIPHFAIGDESALRHYCNFDVVITCSVLDHIEEIRGIIAELKRIANKAVIIAECIEQDHDNYYYKHDYTRWGFVKIMGLDRVSEGDGKMYSVYKWKKYGENSSKGVNDDMSM